LEFYFFAKEDSSLQKKVKCDVGLCCMDSGHHPEYISRKTYKEVCRLSMDRAKHCRKEHLKHVASIKKFVPCIAKNCMLEKSWPYIWKSDELF